MGSGKIGFGLRGGVGAGEGVRALGSQDRCEIGTWQVDGDGSCRCCCLEEPVKGFSKPGIFAIIGVHMIFLSAVCVDQPHWVEEGKDTRSCS
jgi:hypothetical protein